MYVYYLRQAQVPIHLKHGERDQNSGTGMTPEARLHYPLGVNEC